MRKALIKALLVAGGISLVAGSALARGPHGYGKGMGYRNSSAQCQQSGYRYQRSGQGGYRFGDGTQPRPQDGTGFGFKRGLQQTDQTQ